MRNLWMIGVAAILILLIPAPGVSNWEYHPTFYNTARTDDTYAGSVPVPQAQQLSLHRIGVKMRFNMIAGRIVHVDSTVQVTNDLGYNVMVCTYLLVSYVDGGEYAPYGDRIQRAMGTNVTPDIHHRELHASGTFRAPHTGVYEVTQMLYAASAYAPDNYKSVKIDYADLTIVR